MGKEKISLDESFDIGNAYISSTLDKKMPSGKGITITFKERVRRIKNFFFAENKYN